MPTTDSTTTDTPEATPTSAHSPPAARPAPETGPPSGTMRDAMANERTLLAWTRTSIAIFGLGFVVAKFALFLRNLGTVPPPKFGTTFSTVFGAILVVLGSLIMIPALAAYTRRGATVKARATRSLRSWG